MKKVLALIGLLVVCALLSAASDPFAYPVKTVILDAGHGGHDPGTSYAWSFAGGTVYERDLTLDITKRLYALLAVSHPDLQLVMTRTDDTYLTLEERCAKAYSLPLRPQSSALFVSIHVNSAQAGEASGFEILTKAQNKRVTFLDEKTPIENISLFSSHSLLSLNRLLNHRNLVVASNFEKTLSERLITSRNRGVKERDIFVLNASRMPAVLVEVGFLTNEEDARNLVSPQYRQRVAQALATAVELCL
ncbi:MULTISPECIES: N-acetylmuramoyl-L-alanine amidase [Sphaerochaeta]|uniref:N-acetylmuramoyl-L-alanine amidase n=2 Tax=root TaxID=1 RepID=A0ABY4D7Q8_9SPIR|nr:MULTISPECIES: N-acetylmuramoyl-L-alanine amidase [Sphaerochaeta]MDT3358295.1 N-acetylmuramoyl-L-alanine amidase [Spirochaetota bacterium]NLA96761.1 N-acetylmuramoyl-L-alanine amidase [Spirochaetales bacterium]MDD2394158.1 N-acetylmuramoyl-L-alanine amidase [Sphaerochaeta sp.]MDD3423596.1 N-acetylmuramoyl-L-alanine amidase [Sphaerochaeta sp.]MDD3456151.1 N-acetylmuramoyl-L-alanine amidase [Sphaerochaeta sp.]